MGGEGAAQVIHLNWQTMLATIVMTTAALPIASAGAAAPGCVPTSDPGATEIQTEPVLYERTINRLGHIYVEVWEEANGVDGLQPDPTYNCGGAPDVLKSSVCYGCPLTL